MKPPLSFLILASLLLVGCTSTAEFIELAVAGTVNARPPVVQTVPSTVIAEVPVTVVVTQMVVQTVEVPVEVTRVVQEIVTATHSPTSPPTAIPTATDTPQPTATPRPKNTPVPQNTPQPPAPAVDLLQLLVSTRQKLQGFGGMIDSALRDGVISCREVVDSYDALVKSPTYETGSWSTTEKNAYNAYRNSIDVFANGARDMNQNCADFLASPNPGTIPFQQWGLARQRVNEALDILHPAIQALGGS